MKSALDVSEILKLLASNLYLTRKQVAHVLRMSPGTLANWASVGKGPRFEKLGGRVCYPSEAFRIYLEEHNLI